MYVNCSLIFENILRFIRLALKKKKNKLHKIIAYIS